MATPVGDSVALSSNPLINGLLQGGTWDFQGGGAHLTWSVHAFSEGEITSAWSTMLTQTFNAWSAVANITFTRVAAPVQEYASPLAGDIAITLLGVSGQAYAAAVFPDAEVGDLYLSGWSNRREYPRPEGDIDVYSGDDIFWGGTLGPGTLAFSTLLHEIGHSLGLKHPHDDGLNGRPLLTGTGPNGIAYDDGFWTIMSYNDPYIYADMHGKQVTPMPLDILAIQYIYGANMNYRTGNDTYVLQDDHKIRTIWDAGGIDTFSVSSATSGVILNLNAGSFTQVGTVDYFEDSDTPDPADSGSHTAIAFNVVIENAIGSAYNDTILGNAANNNLRGNAGNDTLNGGGGVDVMIGGLGNDTYHVNMAGETVTEAAGQGTDTINAAMTYSLASLVNIENLTLTGAGNTNATGNALNNTLRGNSGTNVLTGGAGNDIYYVTAYDRVVEGVGAGNDTVISSVSYNFTALGIANVESLLLGGYGNINGTGNGFNNTIRGSWGDNVLDGRGGADVMIGQHGNDTYYIDNAGDTIVENAFEGFDRIYSTISITTLQDHVEQINLIGAATNATGNGFDNSLYGNDLVNVLDGGDGDDSLGGNGGNDTLIGGLGDDTYYADAGDTLVEGVGEGIDTVEARADYSIAALANIENLSFMHWDDGYTGTGNSADNFLTGGGGSDTLDGGDGNDIIRGDGDGDGGAGWQFSADTLIGGLGDDTFYVDSIADVVVEAVGEGNDHVYSTVNFSLAATANIEQVTLTGFANIYAVGSVHDDVITGNTGNNYFYGGLGNDEIDGGYGSDRFVFNTALNPATNVDTLHNFFSSDDFMVLDNDIFTTLGVGTLGAAQFRSGSSATTAAHRIIHDVGTGEVWYDADGSGAGAQVLFAQVQTNLFVNNAMFTVID